MYDGHTSATEDVGARPDGSARRIYLGFGPPFAVGARSPRLVSRPVIDALGRPQRILLIGGTSDIGLSIVTSLAGKGTEVILAGRDALAGERKQVTVLFADVVGSTELIRDRDPEDAQRLLDGIVEHQTSERISRVRRAGLLRRGDRPVADRADRMPQYRRTHYVTPSAAVSGRLPPARPVAGG